MGGGDIDYRRNRDRQFAVLTMHKTAPLRNLPDHHRIRRDLIHQDRRRRDIDDRIDRADFVEMHLLHRQTVRLALGLRDDREDPLRQFPRPGTHPGTVENRENIREMAVFVMVVMMPAVFFMSMLMVMVVLFQLHVEIQRRQPVAPRRRNLQFKSIHIQRA